MTRALFHPRSVLSKSCVLSPFCTARNKTLVCMFSVCSRCRLRLATQAPSSISPWPVRSYAQSIDTILDSPDRDELARALDPILHSPRKRRYNPRAISSRSRPAGPGAGHGSQRDTGRGAEQDVQKDAGSSVEESNIFFKPDRPYVNPGTSGFFRPFDAAVLSAPSAEPDGTNIQRLLRSNRFHEAWKILLNLMDSHSEALKTMQAPQKTIEPLISLKKVLDTFKSVWWQFLQHKRHSPSIPTILEIRKGLQGRIRDSDSIINDYVLGLASVVVRYNHPQHDIFQTANHQQLFQELMDFWAVWISDAREGPDADYASVYSLVPKHNGFPGTEGDIKDVPSTKLDTGTYMKKINPEFDEQGNRTTIVDLSLCLLSLLRKAVKKSSLPPYFDDYVPFIREMNQVLRASNIDLYAETLRSALQHQHMHDQKIDVVLHHLRNKPEDIKISFVHPATTSAVKTTAAELTLEELSSRVRTSLARYLERQNLDLVEQSWHAVKARLDNLSAEEKAGTSLHSLYEDFLLAFRGLRRADYTLEVWNHMIKNRCTPTVRTWNVMLKGCHIGKEVDAMEGIWIRMIKAGIQPDAHSWGIRIHGLFQFHKVSEGYRALAEMTEAAKRAALDGRKGANGAPVPKPDTVILNSALSGAARIGPGPVKKLLTWARGQQINLDIITYNILINVAMHTGQKEDARRIMQRMASEGIKPDSATFTILLHSMFQDGFLTDLDPQQQEKHALDFIHSLEKDGMSLDVRGYALLLDRLLKTCQNVKATRAVLDHMIKRGIEPTAHMYTILVTHYFSLDPPDVDAVEALWEGIRFRASYAVDVIFYDRMLEGFARADRLSKMMYFLQRMGQEGKRPGWMALIEVLQCLLRKGDKSRAKELIRDIELSEGNMKAGVRGRKGEEDFWTLAKQVT